MRGKARRLGASFLEVLIAGVLATVLGFTALALIFRGQKEVAIGEDYMFAEALAERALADAMSLPWEQLEEKLPYESDVPGTAMEKEDGPLMKAFPEYGRKLGGSLGVMGKLYARALAPGLVAFELVLRWPTHPGSPADRTYAVVRLRARKDRAISSRFRLAVPGR